MDLGLSDKRALVTGGTRGIGRAIVELLLSEGCHVAFCARDADQVRSTEQMLTREDGPRVLGRAVDVTDAPALTTFVDSAASELEGLDIVVCNVSALAGAPDAAAWRAALEVDVLGTLNTVEPALPHLRRSKSPAIVAIASTAGLELWGGVRAYNSMKAALINYISSLSSTLAGEGIRANTVSPGTIFFEGGVWDNRRKADPEFFNNALAQNPMGRMGTPQEVANAVAFLASPAASFISGTNLVVDGALTRRVQY